MADRAVSPEVNRAIDALDGKIVQPFLAASDPLEVFFPAAGSARDIAHGLPVPPNGVLVVLQQGGNVQATRFTEWTADLAFLVADAANTRAIVIFVVTKGATNALV